MNANRNAVSRFNLLLGVLACTLFPSRSWGRSNAAIREFNEGVKYFNAKQFNEAIPHFDNSISNDSEFPDAFFARGACKYYLKSLDSALMDMNDALRLKSDLLEARALRGAINYESDRWDAAMDDFNYVLTRNSRDAQSLLGRAVILLKRQDTAGAQRDFSGFLQVRPNDPLAPKIRQLVASLKGGPAPEGRAPTRTTPPDSEAASERPARRAAPSSPKLSAADLQRIADSLFARSMSSAYDRSVLHGEKAEATGDIHSRAGVPGNSSSGESDPQIVQP